MHVVNGVPTGRLNLKHDQDSFELVTIQRIEVYQALAETGRATPNAAYSEYLKIPMFARTYRWIAQQLASTRTTHEGFAPQEGAMFWLWGHITRDGLVADAREYGPGHVLLRCRIPRGRALLSDFSAYHGVLYGGVVYTPQELERSYALAELEQWDGTALEQELAAAYGYNWDYENISQNHQQQVAQTWTHALVEEPTSRGDWVQACVSDLRLSDIVTVYELDNVH